MAVWHHTHLGEHGRQLSGGERQRLAIARALIRNAALWILDEPTANLDTITEKAVVKIIREVTKKSTVLWITHRLVQMDYYDRIYVLKNGRISERGRHHQLMRKKGGILIWFIFRKTNLRRNPCQSIDMGLLSAIRRYSRYSSGDKSANM